MKFATGQYALALCDRCGQQYDYTSLRKEWTGLRVCPQCYEPKHPQLEPRSVPFEPEALWHPRPDRKEPVEILVGQNIFPLFTKTSIQGISSVGRIEISVTDSNAAVVTGVLGTGSVGTVTINSGSSTASRFDSTSVKLDSTTKTFDEG